VLLHLANVYMLRCIAGHAGLMFAADVSFFL